MKLLLTIACFLIASFCLIAQDGVGIGVSTPDPSSVLHIQSPASYKGLLIPRFNTADVPAILNPANGLLIFDRQRRSFAYYDSLYSTGGQWQYMRGVPIGAILMWSGSDADIPDGFALCDGSTVNGRKTPNLVSSFIRGSTSTSATFSGALDVIPNLNAIDDNLIYNINNSLVISTPCSAYEFIYTTEISYFDCVDPSQNNVFTIERLGNTCENFPFPSPIDCLSNADYCISVAPNPNYYMLTLEDCLNDNILLYWDLAYIIRVD